MAILGLIIFSSGFHNPFRGDDDLQIVQNTHIQSVGNIGSFFTGSTFYSFNQNEPLTGQYYRPLMTTTFSVIYTFFGANPFYFHLVQTLLIIGAAFFLYLLLSFSVRKDIALLFSLLYLVHPLNSQIAFAIPSMQDALMQLFGLAGLWSLIRFPSTRGLIGTLVLLTLAMFSKEAGILYMVLALLLILLFNRSRIRLFSFSAISILVIYWFIREAAVGGAEVTNIGPISEATFVTRLLTAPSIVMMYLSKFFWPANLSSSYNWLELGFSLSGFLLPLVLILVFTGMTLFVCKLVRENADRLEFKTLIFYITWLVLSLSVYLNIFKPLDMTAAEPWFAIPGIGLMGILAVTSQYLSGRHRSAPLVIAVILFSIVPLLAIRTYVRGGDWSTAQKLAAQDIRTSSDNYIAYNDLANSLFSSQDYSTARSMAERSVSLYSTAVNNDTLGRSCIVLKDYACASKAFDEGLRHFVFAPTLINKSVLTAHYGDPSTNREYLLMVTKYLPNQPYPWYYLALVDHTKLNLQDEARAAIQNAYDLSPDPHISELYRSIMSGGKSSTIIQ